MVPFDFKILNVLFLIFEFLFPDCFTLFELFLVNFLNLMKTLSAKFLALNGIFLKKLLSLFFQVINFPQKLMLIGPKMIQPGVMFDFHELNLFLILKSNVVDLILEELIFLDEASVV